MRTHWAARAAEFWRSSPKVAFGRVENAAWLPVMRETVLNHPDGTPLDWYPVSRDVNNVRNESPDLVRPATIEKELF